MNKPPQESTPARLMLRYRPTTLKQWRQVLIWPIGLGIILGAGLVAAAAITGQDHVNSLVHALFRMCKVMVVIADMGLLYVYGTVAWTFYKSPESATLPEAAEKVRSLARMMGASLLMVITQLFLFHTA